MFRRKLFQPTNHEEIKPFLITFHGCHELVYTVFVNKLRYTRDGHMSDCIGYLVCERRSILCSWINYNEQEMVMYKNVISYYISYVYQSMRESRYVFIFSEVSQASKILPSQWLHTKKDFQNWPSTHFLPILWISPPWCFRDSVLTIHALQILIILSLRQWRCRDDCGRYIIAWKREYSRESMRVWLDRLSNDRMGISRVGYDGMLIDSLRQWQCRGD